MAGSAEAEVKVRILAVAKMLNEGRCVTCAEIMRRLDLAYDIRVDRKTIYSDICAIERFIPIEVRKGRYGGYKKINFEEAFGDGN